MANVPSAAALSAAVVPASWSPLDPNLDPDNAQMLPAFPVDRLPGDWARWAVDAATRTGNAPDHVALGLLAAIAGTAGAGVVAQPIPGWREPLVLWQCAVGPSGPARSAGLDAGRALIDALDDDDEEDQAPRQRVVGEGTLKTVAKVVSRNPNGVIVWRDELAAWMPRGAKPRAGWQEAWSAQPLVINSGNEGKRLRLKRFPVSVIGGLSPELLSSCLKGKDDGFAARFLYAWPAAVPWTPLAERPRPDADAAMKFRLLRNSLGTDAEPLALVFESEAVAAFEAFCRKRHEAPEEDGPLASWQRHAGSMVARLAGVLRLLEWTAGRHTALPYSSLGKVHVEAAIALWEGYFRPHAEAVLRHVHRGQHDDAARRVVRWLKDKGITTVSGEDIRVQALARTVDARGAAKVITYLEAAGILVRESIVTRGRGPKPARWRVKSDSANSESPRPMDVREAIRQANHLEAAQKSASANSANSEPPRTYGFIDAIEEEDWRAAAQKGASANSANSEAPRTYGFIDAIEEADRRAAARKSSSANSANSDGQTAPQELSSRAEREGPLRPQEGSLPSASLRAGPSVGMTNPPKKLRLPESPAVTPPDFPFPYDDGKRVWTAPGVYWRKQGAPGPEHDHPGTAHLYRDDPPDDDDD